MPTQISIVREFNLLNLQTLVIIMTQNTINQSEINMLRSEMELLMRERQALLKIAGIAAGLIAEMDSHDLPIATVEAADLLATSINQLSEETLQDALAAVHAEIIG